MAVRIFRLVFRHSVEHTYQFIDDSDTFHLICYYVKHTQMKRAHTQGTLKQNSTCYYRAAEMLINESLCLPHLYPSLESYFKPLKAEWLPHHPAELKNEELGQRHKLNLRLDLTVLEGTNTAASIWQ